MLWWFAETTLIAGILAGAATLCGRLRSISSTARHLLWLVVLIKLILPPVIPSPWALPSPPSIWPRTEAGTVEDPAFSIPVTPPAPQLSTAEASPNPLADTSSLTVSHEVEAPFPGTARQPEREPISEPTPRASGWHWLTGFLDRRSFLLRRLALSVWILGTLILALFQASRIVAFRRRLRDAVPAPTWLVEEAQQLGERLEVHVPELLVVPGLGTPMLWCLGCPKLLLPGHLIKSIEAARWRGILAHELAHLRRGDHWVGRIELVASLLWWWNPLYWLTCRRLDAEAELACDAWVVWALPHERLDYAEVLVHVCSEFSRAGMSSPALGVAGSGRFLERRLSMILYERATCRVSPPVLLAAALLALLSLPSWTFATASAAVGPRQDEPAAQDVSTSDSSASQVVDDKDDDREDDAMEDDADDDDEDAKSSQDKAAAKHKEKSLKSKTGEKDLDIDLDLSGFEKKIELWADKFSKEIEEKFGDNSEFVKKMEAFGEEMEKKFGDDSEFAKKMEALGEEMEKKFGDDSEFAKKMEALGKEMEKKFGPGSEFEKKIKQKFGPGSDFEKSVKQKFGPGSDFEKKIKADAEKLEREAKEQAKKVEAEHIKRVHATDEAKKAKPSVDSKSRDQRIKAMEAQIQQLLGDLKALKDAEDNHEE